MKHNGTSERCTLTCWGANLKQTILIVRAFTIDAITLFREKLGAVQSARARPGREEPHAHSMRGAWTNTPATRVSLSRNCEWRVDRTVTNLRSLMRSKRSQGGGEEALTHPPMRGVRSISLAIRRPMQGTCPEEKGVARYEMGEKRKDCFCY